MLVILGETLSILIPKKDKELCQYWDEEIKTTKSLNVNIGSREYYQIIVIVHSTPSKHIAETGIKVSMINRLFTSDQCGSHVKSPTTSNIKLLTW